MLRLPCLRLPLPPSLLLWKFFCSSCHSEARTQFPQIPCGSRAGDTECKVRSLMLCGDLPQSHRSSTPQILPYGTERVLPSFLSSRKVRETSFLGERKTALCSLVGALQFIHTFGTTLPTPIPSTNTALRTANTAPSTMRFWEAASRWRSQRSGFLQ